MGVRKQFASFEELINHSPLPILVDFNTHLCGPCRMLNPILEQVQARLKHKLQIVKIDSEQYPALSHQYQIHALPTLLLFKQGQLIDRFEGLIAPEKLLERLKPLL
jgi:thioredoxin